MNPPEKSRKTILIVGLGDTSEAREIAVVLNHEGYIVRGATTAEAALRELKTGKIDYVVMAPPEQRIDCTAEVDLLKQIRGGDFSLRNVGVVFYHSSRAQKDGFTALSRGISGISYISHLQSGQAMLDAIEGRKRE